MHGTSPLSLRRLMNSPGQVPGEHMKRNFGFVFFGFLLALATCAYVFTSVPQFEALFGGFGVDLPVPTMLVMRYYNLVLLLPALVLPVAAALQCLR